MITQADLPKYICVKIALDATRVDFIVPGLAQRLFSLTLAAAIRGRGVLIEGPPMLRERGSECIGLFQVTDWKAGVQAVLAEAQAQNTHHGLMIGWHDRSEDFWRTCFPLGSTEDFAPIAARLFQWLKETT